MHPLTLLNEAQLIKTTHNLILLDCITYMHTCTLYTDPLCCYGLSVDKVRTTCVHTQCVNTQHCPGHFWHCRKLVTANPQYMMTYNASILKDIHVHVHVAIIVLLLNKETLHRYTYMYTIENNKSKVNNQYFRQSYMYF